MQIEVKLKLKLWLWKEEIYRGQTPQNLKLKIFLPKNSKTSTPQEFLDLWLQPCGVLVLLICVQILVHLDCFSHSITMKCENPLGEKQPKFTETSTPEVGGSTYYFGHFFPRKSKKGPRGGAGVCSFCWNCTERQILWSLCSVDFHTLTLQLPIQTPHSVAPELQVFVSSLKFSAKRAHPGARVPGGVLILLKF